MRRDLLCVGLFALLFGGVQGHAQDQALPKSIPAHTAAVNAAVYTPDGRFVVTGGADQLVKIWDAQTGAPVRELAGHTGQVMSVAVSPDNSSIVSAASDNSLRMWDIPRPEPLRTFPGIETPVHDVATSSDGQWAVSVGEDSAARIWRMEDATTLLTLEGHVAPTVRAAIRNDNAQLATADADGEIRFWNPQDGAPQGTIGAHAGAVSGLAFHPNNQQLVTAGADGQLKVWQLPVAPPRPLAGSSGAVRAIVLNSNGQLTLTGGDDGVRSFTTSTGALVREFAEFNGPARSVAISANDTIAAAAGDAGVIKIWNVADGADRFRIAGHDGPIRSIAFHPDNARIASAGDDGTVRLWRLPVAPTPLNGHTGDVLDFSFSPNGQIAVSVSADKTVRAWNPVTGQAVWQQTAGEQSLTRLAFRADNLQLAHGDSAGAIQLRNVADGALQSTIGAHVGDVRGLAYHPGGEMLATIGADLCLKVWNLNTPPALSLAGNAESVSAVALTQDVKLILTAGADKSIRIYNAETGQQARVLAEVPDAVTSMALNHDDTVVAAGHADGRIKLWNLADGKPLADSPAELFGHDGPVSEILFDATSQTITSTGADGTLRHWKIPPAPEVAASPGGETTAFAVNRAGKIAAVAGVHQTRPAVFLLEVGSGKTLQTLLGHEGAINNIAFSNDGKLLTTGGADNTARLWNLADPKFPQLQKAQHAAPVTAVAISPDGTQFYSAATDNVIRCWSAADGSLVREIKGHTGAVAGMTARGETLFSASADGTVRLWKTADGAAIRSINHGAAISCLSVDDAGALVASGGADSNVKLWNAADGAAIAALAGHSSALIDLQLSKDATRLVSLSAAELFHWDVAGERRLESFVLGEGEKRGAGFWGERFATVAADGSLTFIEPNLLQLIDAHAGGTLSLALLPDGKRAITSGADKTVKLWNLEDGQPLATFAGPADVIHAVAVTPDGERLLAGGTEKTLIAWPIPKAAAAQPVAADGQWELPAAITSLHISADVTRVAIGADDNIVRVWDYTIGRELQRLADHTASIQDVRLSTDGQTVISGSADKTARKTSLALASVAVLKELPNAVAYTADGSTMIIAGETPQLSLWQLGDEGLTQSSTLPAADAQPEGYAAAPQQALAVRSDAAQVAALDAVGRTHVWNLEDGTLELAIAAPAPKAKPADDDGAPQAEAQAADAQPVPPAGKLQFSADGGMLLIGKDQILRIVETSTGQLLESFAEPSPITAVAMGVDNLAIGVARLGTANNAVIRKFSLERLIDAHDGPVTSIAFTPDGTALLTGGEDNALHLWTADGKKIRTYTGSEAAITSAAITKDGSQILAASADKFVRTWPLVPNPAEGETPEQAAAKPVPATSTVEFPAVVHSIRPSDDNTRFAAATGDGVIRVHQLQTGIELQRFTTGSPTALAVALSPDNRTVVSGESPADVADAEAPGPTAHAWTMSLVRNIEADDQTLHDVALANAGVQAVTTGAGGVNHWNLADGAMLRKLSSDQVEYFCVAVRGDNQQVIAGSSDSLLHFWNLTNGQPAGKTDLGAAARRIRYSADNTAIAAACADDRMRFFNPADRQPTYELTSDQPIAGIAFTSDGRNVLTGGAQMRQWLYASPTATRTLSGHSGSVYSATFSRDGRWIASTSADQTVRIWNAETGAQAKQLSGHQGAVYSSSFSADGALLVSCGADKSVRLWDTLGGRQLKQIPVGDDSLYTIAFFPDGKRVATAGLDRTVYFVDAITGKVENKIEKHRDYVYRAAFNTAGTRLLTCGYGGNIVVWNVANGQALHEESLRQVTNFAAFSPDGSRIAVAGGDGKVHFLDLPANAK